MAGAITKLWCTFLGWNNFCSNYSKGSLLLVLDYASICLTCATSKKL